MKKLLFAAIIASLLFVFTGCAQHESSSVRICIDIGSSVPEGRPEETAERFVQNFVDYGKAYDGPTNFEFEVIPAQGAERKTAIERIRTEIMSGGGPDVFIVSNAYYETTGENALFPTPEKAMESHIFLSLDQYIEENAQFTDWNNQVQSVMAAGQNSEGQLIVPLSYTFPVTCFRKSEVEHTASKDITWENMLADESNVMRAAGTWYHASSNDFELWEDHYLECVLGQLADYSEEKLLFTEEEMLQRIQEIIQLKKRQKAREFADVPDHYQLCMNVGYDSDSLVGYNRRNTIKNTENLTMIPLYSDDGGVTATVVSYAAVNRNTKRPEDAFFVLDVMLTTPIQRTSEFYGALLNDVALPMQTDLLQDRLRELRVQGWGFLNPNFTEFCNVRDQITSVHFRNILLDELNSAYYRCEAANGDKEKMREIVSEAYQSMQRMLAE